MVDMKKESVDTLTNPEDNLIEEMKKEGSSNDTQHNQFLRSDEVDLVGDGVPGYETTGESKPIDQQENIIEEQKKPKP